MRHVALLRGINVGGKNKLAMKDLAAMFVDAGCTDVVTYIQSGNVVFTAPSALAKKIPALIEAAIAKKARLQVPVIVRSAAELVKIASSNPYLKGGIDPDLLHLVFLRDIPSSKQAATLDPNRSPPDQFTARDSEIYLFLPRGAGQSKLTAVYFDAKLETTVTQRNWRTVLKLVELVSI